MKKGKEGERCYLFTGNFLNALFSGGSGQSENPQQLINVWLAIECDKREKMCLQRRKRGTMS